MLCRSAPIQNTAPQCTDHDPLCRRAYEVFTLLLRVAEHPELREGGKVIWRLQYLSGGRSDEADGQRRHPRRKIVTQLNLQKDDTQMVLPMAKVGAQPAASNSNFFSRKVGWMCCLCRCAGPYACLSCS